MPTLDASIPSSRHRSAIALTAVTLVLLTSVPSRAASPENEMPNATEALKARSYKEVHKEVLELHQFFQDWFNAALEPTDGEFARFADVMADGFVIVSPGGRASEREPLVQGLRAAHGRWKDQPGRIWIENFVLRRTTGETAIVTYEEWQESADGTRGRLSTAIFEEREGTPNGVAWLHVHETWLPPDHGAEAP